MRSTHIASALLAGASALAISTVAFAQTAPAGAGNEVVVTGSRVIQNGNNSPTPLTVITTDQMLDLQPTILADALNDLPVFTGSMSQTTNPGNSSRNSAEQQLNLRSFGATRTLILFDGHRVAPSDVLGAVDVDVIPQMLIQRVDVVTGGVSAVYGSEAITGVVNYVTDSKFQGLKINLSGGITQYGDDGTFDGAFAYGAKVLGDRGHFEISYQYHNDPGIFSQTNRTWKALDWTEQGAGTTADPYRLVTLSRIGTSSFGGVITAAPFITLPSGCATTATCPYLEFNQQGVLTPFVHGAPTGTNNDESGGDGAYYDTASIKSSLTSHQLFARFDYDFTDSIHGYAEIAATFNHNKNNHQLNEVRGTSAPDPGVLGLNNAYLIGVTMPAGIANPYNANCTTNTSACTFQFGKMFQDMPTLQPDAYQKNYLIETGLNGDIGNYKWTLGYEYSLSQQNTRNNGNINLGHLLAAENAVINPANGQIVCHAALVNPAYANCVPIDMFGPNAESQAAINYVIQVTQFWAQYNMHDVTGSFSGSPFSTWAGPVQMALSGEWRRLGYSLVSQNQPTDVVDCNGIQFNCINTTTGLPSTLWSSNVQANRSPVEQTVKEIAYEIDVPLIKNVPLFQALNLNGAVRYTSYDTSGSYPTWKVGVDWHVNDELTVRATRSRDIRAPNLNDLFAPTAYNPAGYVDLHTGNVQVQTTFETVSNPNLTAETGDTTTAGFVVRPAFIPRFSLSVDAFHIVLTNAIASVQGQNPAIQTICENSGGTSPYCALLLRPLPFSNHTSLNSPTATLTESLNIASIDSYGADIEANYATNAIFGRPLTVRVLSTWQPHIVYNNGPLGIIDAGNSVAGQTGQTPSPSLKMTAIFKYNVTDNFSVGILEKWHNSLIRSSVRTQVYIDPPVPAMAYTDLTLSYNLKSSVGNSELFLNILNLWNTPPSPYGGTGGGSGVPGLFGGLVPGLDDPIGRDFNIGIRFRH